MLSGQANGDEGPEPGAVGDGGTADGSSEEDPAEPGTAGGDAANADGGPAVFLSEPVRRRAIEIAAVAMPGLGQGKVPARLRRFLKFSPVKHAKLAKSELAVALASDTAFREGLAEVLTSTDSPLIEAIATGGEVSPMADPAEVAALAYLLRPEGWRELIATAVQAIPEPVEAAAAEAPAEAGLKRLAALEKENGKLRAALAEQRSAAAVLQEDVRRARRELKEAEERAAKAAGDLAAERGRLKHSDAERRSERRRLESEVESLKDQLDRIRKAGREHERLASARLWLLMETLSGTATGLRRELGLEPVPDRPADYIADELCAEPEERTAEGSRGLEQTDPQRLDHLLSLPEPASHRRRLQRHDLGLGRDADARAAAQPARAGPGHGRGADERGDHGGLRRGGRDLRGQANARGVRVLFSAKGQIADDVVVELVRVEPEGRPVVVVSSDQEVAMRVRREGAFPVPSPVLVRWLQRS